jgi:hypothetical protein
MTSVREILICSAVLERLLEPKALESALLLSNDRKARSPDRGSTPRSASER